jgi:hypothetical protein
MEKAGKVKQTVWTSEAMRYHQQTVTFLYYSFAAVGY